MKNLKIIALLFIVINQYSALQSGPGVQLSRCLYQRYGGSFGKKSSTLLHNPVQRPSTYKTSSFYYLTKDLPLEEVNESEITTRDLNNGSPKRFWSTSKNNALCTIELANIKSKGKIHYDFKKLAESIRKYEEEIRLQKMLKQLSNKSTLTEKEEAELK